MLPAFAFCNCRTYVHMDRCFKLVASKLPDPGRPLSDTLPSATVKAANEAACTSCTKSNQTTKTEFSCGRIEMMFPIFHPMCTFLGPVT